MTDWINRTTVDEDEVERGQTGREGSEKRESRLSKSSSSLVCFSWSFCCSTAATATAVQIKLFAG